MTPLYAVLSETLYDTIPILDDGSGPEEPYAIFEIVAARNRSAAIYAAWRAGSDEARLDPREKPRFLCRRLGTTRRPPGIYTAETWPYRKAGAAFWLALAFPAGGG